ncbi:Flagellar basal-body rod protein FlgG [Baekduia alba]|uniref:flagellar hook-basal body protein n=1 Tax=Baekduia alba TaxID=2997333 RepID=UPI0023404DC1|nr:flagellar hook-basal body protein [Baekduia alba]WCB91357.1 Flagellar basal-body rod protein FlgG [Baekduia alba]
MYTAAAGMAAQQTRLDAVSSDLANVDTTGYKSARVAFRDLVYDDAQGYGAAKGVTIGAGSAATSIGRSSAQGALQDTKRTLDVALNGPGFLQVKLADGSKALTRDGNLEVAPDGRLRLSSGGQVLEPAIKVPAGADPDAIKIGSDGSVSYNNVALGQIKIVDVPAPTGLQGGPGNTYVATKASGATRAADKSTILTQGSLEASNVDEATAMTDMIEAQRAFQMASKAITTQDQVLEIANQVKK